MAMARREHIEQWKRTGYDESETGSPNMNEANNKKEKAVYQTRPCWVLEACA